MTETEWLECADPEAMLHFLKGKVSERKLRLFACACCRRVEHLLHDERSVATIDIIERHADSAASDGAFIDARYAAQSVLEEMVGKVWTGHPAATDAGCMVRNAAGRCPEHSAKETVLRAAGALALEIAGPCPFNTPDLVHHIAWRTAHRAAWRTACVDLCGLLRDVVGNPFRAPRLNEECLAWNDGTVPRIAHTIYAERAFEQLPILGDALDDAGCKDGAIVNHCREKGTHVRGCWAVDLLRAGLESYATRLVG
jgi:hypothetical protein